MSHGDFEALLPEPVHDELGDLVHALETLRSQLAARIEELRGEGQQAAHHPQRHGRRRGAGAGGRHRRRQPGLRAPAVGARRRREGRAPCEPCRGCPPWRGRGEALALGHARDARGAGRRARARRCHRPLGDAAGATRRWWCCSTSPSPAPGAAAARLRGQRLARAAHAGGGDRGRGRDAGGRRRRRSRGAQLVPRHPQPPRAAPGAPHRATSSTSRGSRPATSRAWRSVPVEAAVLDVGLVVAAHAPQREDHRAREAHPGDGPRVRPSAPRSSRSSPTSSRTRIKYTPAGGRVRGGAERCAAAACASSSRTAAPGIPAEHLARLFERFYRVDERALARPGRHRPGARHRQAPGARQRRRRRRREPGRPRQPLLCRFPWPSGLAPGRVHQHFTNLTPFGVRVPTWVTPAASCSSSTMSAICATLLDFNLRQAG